MPISTNRRGGSNADGNDDETSRRSVTELTGMALVKSEQEKRIKLEEKKKQRGVMRKLLKFLMQLFSIGTRSSRAVFEYLLNNFSLERLIICCAP